MSETSRVTLVYRDGGLETVGGTIVGGEEFRISCGTDRMFEIVNANVIEFGYPIKLEFSDGNEYITE